MGDSCTQPGPIALRNARGGRWTTSRQSGSRRIAARREQKLHPAAEFHSSGWIRTTGLTIMSRARAVNRGDARRLKHTKVLEFMDIANAPLARA
jgi:hypothetical protein